MLFFLVRNEYIIFPGTTALDKCIPCQMVLANIALTKGMRQRSQDPRIFFFSPQIGPLQVHEVYECIAVCVFLIIS